MQGGGNAMPFRSGSESIAEIRISDCPRMRIGQFPIGAVKRGSVIGNGLWSSARYKALIRGNKGGRKIIAHEL